MLVLDAMVSITIAYCLPASTVAGFSKVRVVISMLAGSMLTGSKGISDEGMVLEANTLEVGRPVAGSTVVICTDTVY